MSNWPVVVLSGPRQCGKSTLGRRLATSPDHFFDLENQYRDAARLDHNAYEVLSALSGVVVVDEIQTRPQLFELLRVLADRPQPSARFLITGSVSPLLMKGATESLAGRACFLEMDGFTLEEVSTQPTWDARTAWRQLWLRGGFPRSYLAGSVPDSVDWRLGYLHPLINRDWRSWSETSLTPPQIRKLLTMVAETSGQFWAHKACGDAIGADYRVVQRFLEAMQSAYAVREMPVFASSSRVRLRKRPKILLRDVGLMHALLGVEHVENLEASPRLGGSWETFLANQLIRLADARDHEVFTWSVESGPEVDLLIRKGDRMVGFEFKHGARAEVNASLKAALTELPLQHLYVVSDTVDVVKILPRLTLLGPLEAMRVAKEMASAV